jgi:hypothetical protein
MTGIYKQAVGIGSGVMTYMPNFIKIGSGIQTLIGEDTQTYRQHGDLLNLFYFLKKYAKNT